MPIIGVSRDANFSSLNEFNELAVLPLLVYVLCVGTLQTGYFRVHTSRQDKKQDMHPRAVTCPTALDLHSCQGGQRRCHVPYSSEPRFSAEVGSDDATCLVASDHASRLRWALILPRVLRLWTSLPYWGGLRHCHASCGSLWAACLMYKERHSWPTYAARFTCFQGVLT
jgi:hypothetical protein